MAYGTRSRALAYTSSSIIMTYYCISGGLSVDWLSNKLYIRGYNHLEVIDLNNGYRKELNSTTVYNSGRNVIAVDPTNRYNACV